MVVVETKEKEAEQVRVFFHRRRSASTRNDEKRREKGISPKKGPRGDVANKFTYSVE
jgi:hypothetical protein